MKNEILNGTIFVMNIRIFKVDDAMMVTHHKDYATLVEGDFTPIDEWILLNNIKGDILDITESGNSVAISYDGPDPHTILTDPTLFMDSYENNSRIILLGNNIEE